MNSLTRLIGFTVLLLLLFLGAGMTAQAWLHRETRRLQAEANGALQTRMSKIVELYARPAASWSEAELRAAGELIGGSVQYFPTLPPIAPPSERKLVYDYSLAGPAAATDASRTSGVLRVMVPTPHATQLLAIYQRAFAALLLLALGFLLLVVAAALLLYYRRRETREGSAPPFALARSDMRSLEHLAKTSVARGEALAQERSERQLTEQDLQFNRQLLSQALEEKIRLGRDLHDGIIQSLYAAGLTLEAARGLAAKDPVAADQKLAQILDAINATIREVRAYIRGLTPEALHRAGFKQALTTLTEELRANRDVAFDLRLDDEAATQLSLEQTREVLQIAREAVSNSLRHGQATSITIRLQPGDGALCLLVQDNGAGFDPARLRPDGHGIGNMEARAARLGGTIRLESRPGAGTRLVLTLPVLENPHS